MLCSTMKGAFMKRTIFLSFALSCAAIAQQPSTSTTPSPEQVENAIQRLPAAYRNAANTFLHLENENLAHIASESDQKWIDESIATILRNPDGRSFLIDQLEKEPDGRLRASILIAAQKSERAGTESSKYALTPAELGIVRRHASGDPDPKAAAAALNIIYLADRIDEQSLLEARRNLGDSSELSDLEWAHFTKYGEMIRNPLFNYNPPPLFGIVPGNQSVRVLAFGDFGTGEAGQVQDAHAMLAYHKQYPFDFGLTLGDNFYSVGLNSPDDPRWQTQWEQLYGPLGIKFYPVYGNHDYDDPDSPAAELAYSRKSKSWVFPAPYYTFTAGAAQFFAIDNIRLTDSELAWLDDALSKSTAKWKIVYGHYHMYSATRGDERSLIKRLLPMLEKNHVEIYLNGHDHNMQEARTESPVHFFTSGAGGAGLYNMQPNYKKSIFKDKQFGFSVLEIDEQHVDVIFVDMDGKEVYRSHITD
jgi:tartrate-resistant acid phosphatase type 5